MWSLEASHQYHHDYQFWPELCGLRGMHVILLVFLLLLVIAAFCGRDWGMNSVSGRWVGLGFDFLLFWASILPTVARTQLTISENELVLSLYMPIGWYFVV